MKRLNKLRERAESLKNEILALSLALKDRRTPLLAKILIAISVSYALSPIDLIPDFIPVLGYVDDLILLPGLIALAIKMIPKEVLEDCRARAREPRLNKKAGWIAAAVILSIWILLAMVIIRRITR